MHRTSKIETDRDGSPQTLIVYYTGNEYDAAIKEARKLHGFEHKPITVLAIPEH